MLLFNGPGQIRSFGGSSVGKNKVRIFYSLPSHCLYVFKTKNNAKPYKIIGQSREVLIFFPSQGNFLGALWEIANFPQ